MINRTPISTAAALVIAAGIASAQDCAWEFFPAPPAYNDFHVLFGVDGLSADDVWAVGRATEYVNFKYYRWNYALHFDGSQWSHVPTPSPDATGGWNNLWGVLALGPDDAMAVGHANPPSGPGQNIAMRWDGSEWSMLDTPFYQGGSTLFGIDRIDGDIWAVGTRRWGQDPPATSNIALALRWNGSGWDDEFVPPLAALGDSFNYLYAVGGVSADDIWAVGSSQQRYADDPWGPRTYMVHWDGSEWSIVDQDFGYLYFSSFTDIEAIAADDVWVVGYTTVSGEGTQPLIIHYDGTSWTQADLPIFPEGPTELRAVAARSSDDVYAMGTWADNQGFPRDFILHYDGTEWTRMDSAPVNGIHQWYRAAATLPNGDVWTVGQFYDSALQNTIAITERLSCDGGVCLADFNGDGVVDTRDFLAFLSAWAAGDPSADMNGDTVIDSLDFLVFLNLWAAGC